MNQTCQSGQNFTIRARIEQIWLIKSNQIARGYLKGQRSSDYFFKKRKNDRFPIEVENQAGRAMLIVNQFKISQMCTLPVRSS